VIGLALAMAGVMVAVTTVIVGLVRFVRGSR
jgi:hypothetical protein